MEIKNERKLINQLIIVIAIMLFAIFCVVVPLAIESNRKMQLDCQCVATKIISKSDYFYEDGHYFLILSYEGETMKVEVDKETYTFTHIGSIMSVIKCK